VHTQMIPLLENEVKRKSVHAFETFEE